MTKLPWDFSYILITILNLFDRIAIRVNSFSYTVVF